MPRCRPGRAPLPADEPESHLTAWHVFLAELIRYFADPHRVDVRDFVKLGTLPLEADVILLRKQPGEPSPGFHGLLQDELDFLEVRMRDLTVLEYKSPKDQLTRRSVDMARVYGLLGKLKFNIAKDAYTAIALLYSQAQRGLFEELREDGLPFIEEEAGILCCKTTPVIYAMNLTVLGQRRPQSPLNLVSARHAEYSDAPGTAPHALALVERIQYLIKQGKYRGMAVDKLQGMEELSRDADAIRRRFLQSIDTKQRLEGLDTKQRLEGLDPREVLETLGDKLDPSQEEALLALLLARRDQRR